jgi:hypothetical protein
MPETMGEPLPMTPVAAPDRLPAAVGSHYLRMDTYQAPGGALQAFYSDGLFSFSLFESPRSDTPAAFDRATRFEVAGESYRRLVMPSDVWVLWHAPDRTYLLVGDLPPDHLEQVLVDLPEPGDRAWPVRWWRRLFG